MKKVKIIGALALTSVLGLMASGCSEDFIKEGGVKSDLAYYSATVVSLADTNTQAAASRQSEINMGLGNTVLFDENDFGVIEGDYFQEILKQIDVIVSNENKFECVSLESDKEEYLYLQEVSFYDHEQNKQSYKLYYNDVNEEIEIEDDEEEKEISFEGIACIGDKELKFEFKHETEIEEDEKEDETELKLYFNEDSYVKVENEFEVEGNEKSEEYKYTLVKDDEEVVSYSIEVEVENNKTEIELEINDFEVELEMVNIDGVDYIKLEVDDVKKYYKKVVNETGYTFELIDELED